MPFLQTRSPVSGKNGGIPSRRDLLVSMPPVGETSGLDVPVARGSTRKGDFRATSVVCDRLITNGSRLLGKHARASGDLDLQRGGGLGYAKRWRGTGPRPTMKGGRLHNRSAGACPPRSLDPRENCTPTQAIPRADRGTARDRPSPYDERRRPPQP